MTSLLDPDRVNHKYQLVARSDTKLCPKQVARCEHCRISFQSFDIAEIKTVGLRERYDKKTGEIVKQQANVYLHFLTECLKQYDQKFKFSSVMVSNRTQEHLPSASLDLLKSKGCNIE